MPHNLQMCMQYFTNTKHLSMKMPPLPPNKCTATIFYVKVYHIHGYIEVFL